MENKKNGVKIDKKKSIKKDKNKLVSTGILLTLFIVLTSLFFTLGLNPKVKDKLSYEEVGNLDYYVYLKPNNYFKKDVLPKNMEYIASLIDHINLIFNYEFNTADNFDYKYTYGIDAKIISTDKLDNSKLLYEEDFVLLEPVSGEKKDSSQFSISPVLSIDYNKYNDIMKAFKNDYILSMDSNLIVTLNVKLDGMYKDSKDNISRTQTQQITIPLSEQTINIDFNSDVVEDSGEIKVYYESRTRKIIYLTLAFASLICSVIFCVCFINHLRKEIDKKSKYLKALNKIMKEYDRIIVNSDKVPDISNCEVINVTTFEELIDVRESIQAPILFVEINKGSFAWFIIKSENIVYRYILNAKKIRNGE